MALREACLVEMASRNFEQTPNGAVSSPGVALDRRVPRSGDHRVFWPFADLGTRN
jgi:hypothetical protein